MKSLVALLTACACSGNSHTVADDSDAGGAAGLADSGGGATSTSGTAGEGGAVEGGSSNAGVDLSVRCFDHGDDRIVCYGTPGTDNWAVIWPDCSIRLKAQDPELEPVADPAAVTCEGLPGAPDSITGWEDVACFRQVRSRFVECYGKLGGSWFEIFADCVWASMTASYVGDPAEILCGVASAERGGWDEIRCFDVPRDPGTVCYGRRGAYWVGPTALAHYANGLFAACELGRKGTPIEVGADGPPCPMGPGSGR